FIELFPAGERGGAPDKAAQASYQHLCLGVEDIYAAVEEIRARGCPIDVEPKQGMDGNIQAWITDPDGNRIELMQMMPGSPQTY
ncbi:MAG: VOC family protein, partial [Clostridia bacterium]|nr:VOC family protein [Clostridia bacterium]